MSVSINATVLYELEEGLATVTLNRPERHNAFNDEMSSELRAVLDEVLNDPKVRCVLLRGNGPSFSSGRDTAELGRRPGGLSDFTFVQRAQQTRLAVLDTSKPIVAELRGFALGGACELALSADIRVR